MNAIDKISRILRTDKDILKAFAQQAEALTNKKNILDKIEEENRMLINNRLQLRGLDSELKAEDIYMGLVDKIKQDDLQLFKALGKPSFILEEDVQMLLEKVRALLPTVNQPGFFLKKEKAAELLMKNLPVRVMNYLGYHSPQELLDRDDIFEIFAAIRLFEDRKWFNDVFLKECQKLQPEDFEKRTIIFRALNQKWAGIAQSFLKKKYQNISHLKELGMVFVVPTELGIPGEITRMFSLLLHYFFEVRFYADLFEDLAIKDPRSFGNHIAELIKVDAPPKSYSVFESNKLRFLVLPSYLAKDDENDLRLSFPHISLEVLFWEKAETALRGLNNLLKNEEFHVDFSFWEDLDWVGDYFSTVTGIEILVSFNFVDTTMSLLKERELIKYLYHHQEALWNKIFTEYFGYETLEKCLKENLLRGYFEL
jgi:hypothetical protein